MLFSRLKQPLDLVLLVVTLLAYGCPTPTLVAAFGLDERTIATWQCKAGQHAKQVHTHLVCHGSVDLGQVQADELYTKTQAGPVWIATAMSVFSRLWLWGALSWQRDEALITPVLAHVGAAAQPGRPLLFAVDGFKAYVTAILKVFRNPQRTGANDKSAAAASRLPCVRRGSGMVAPAWGNGSTAKVTRAPVDVVAVDGMRHALRLVVGSATVIIRRRAVLGAHPERISPTPAPAMTSSFGPSVIKWYADMLCF
jgi:hypothetical protein